MIVAIDGPAGAGKTTVAKAVAADLGFDYLDTGALYRAIALAALEQGVRDEAGLGDLATSAQVEVEDDRVFLDRRDVTGRIRDADVTLAVSGIAAKPAVRAALVRRQREMAAGRNVVVEGRDIGTVVFPEAEVKIYLVASLNERARRRAAELGGASGRGMEEMKALIAARDEADVARALSPLKPAADAAIIDATTLSASAVAEQIAALARGALDEKGPGPGRPA